MATTFQSVAAWFAHSALYVKVLAAAMILAILLAIAAPLLRRLRRRAPGAPMLSEFASPLVTAVLLACILFAVLLAIPNVAAVRLPGNQMGYEPVQPIAFSHRLHAGELQVSCVYCHFGAEKSRYAGVPPANVCMNCHRFVSAPLGAVRAEDEQAKKGGRPPRRIVSPEIQKIYDALALDGKLQRDASRPMHPIVWTKVHNLPDFVYFNHSAHVGAGVACQTCHGPVETMERVRQVKDLSMGWCVNCHRDVNANGLTTAAGAKKRVYASTDCSTCHF